MNTTVRTIHGIRDSALIVFIILALHTSALGVEDQTAHGIPYHIVADYIHDIIEADRTLYTTHVVDRMQETGTAIASEGWKDRNALPLPAQMLLLSGERVRKNNGGLHYRLASLWPIYEKNGPANDFEREGLETVTKHPEKPYTGYISQGEKTLYTAIYADLAVSKSCVNCHNRHLLSPKRDQKLGDVMGGIIISFPVKQEHSSR